MSELPKYECHLCLEAGRKNWKQRCPWALKLAEMPIYHRNLNVALDLKLAKSELSQKNIPGLAASLKAMGCLWWSLAVLRFPGEISPWQLQIQHNQTIKCHIQPSVFPIPTFTSEDFLLLQSLLWCFRTTWKFGLEGFHASGSKSESLLFLRFLCKCHTSVQGMQIHFPSQGPAAYVAISLPWLAALKDTRDRWPSNTFMQNLK